MSGGDEVGSEHVEHESVDLVHIASAAMTIALVSAVVIPRIGANSNPVVAAGELRGED